MNYFKRRLVLAVFLCLALSPAGNLGRGAIGTPADALKPTVILISLDAFRFDYLAKYNPPNLTALAHEGVQAKWMTPSFPSLTFPNHYTIATGLYPEDHGIVANEFYDPVFKATFVASNRASVQDGRWWGGEPIWITAEKQGQHAACYFFPGSEAEIEGRRPTFWEQYDEKVPDSQRVDTALRWLDLPAAQRPTFIALYFSDVDEAGHRYAPNSPQVATAVADVDRAVGRLVKGLKDRSLYDQVNVIVVSDHGMAQIQARDVVLLDDAFQVGKADKIIWNAEVTHIFPKEGATGEILSELSSGKVKHAQCYLKENVPARFHYQHNRRIGPIVCMADEGWRIFAHAKYNDDMSNHRIPDRLIGAHGYDNQLPTMRATFLAHGPAFKHGVVVDPFPNVNVYDMMTSILGLKPAPNDGNMAVASTVLR